MTHCKDFDDPELAKLIVLTDSEPPQFESRGQAKMWRNEQILARAAKRDAEEQRAKNSPKE